MENLQDSARRDDDRGNVILWVILALAAGLRLVAAILLPDQHFPDTESYRAIAQEIWSFHRFDVVHVMPLYPLVIAVTGGGWGQLIFDIAMSTVAVWLIHMLTLTLFGDRLTALLAAATAAIYPFFIFYAVVGLTETLFITLLLAAYAAWYRGRFATAALCAVLSILTRPIIDPLPPFLIVYFALVIHRSSVAVAARQVALYVLIYCALMAPWWLHNTNAYGTFVRLNLGSGLALYSGNNPQNRSGGVSDVNLDTSQYDRIADPVARDRALRDAGLDYIAADPVRFFKLAGLKFMRFWRLWPYADAYAGAKFVVISLVSYVPVLLLALMSVVTCGRTRLIQIAPILFFVGYLTLVHMIVVGSIRYRLPIEPFLIVLAAPAARRIYDYLRQRFEGQH